MHDPASFDRTTSARNHSGGSDTPPASAGNARSKAPPERIGRYRITGVLGGGGFGDVYLARDEQLQREVAIKVPHAELVSRTPDVSIYLAEAQTVAGLDHPHIVPVYDIGTTLQFPFFIVSKFINGSTLAQRADESRLSFAEAAELVATIALALHHAHMHGLVHRDVKPGNILVGKDDKPYVVDFGLALRESEIGQGPRYAGTPAYMSPEQARGEGHRVDGRSDIFSLGVVLYELLVGQRPFRGDTKVELLERVATHEPRPPRQYDDRIPKELERICLKAMSKRSSDRYSTAKDMANELRSFIETRTEAVSSTFIDAERDDQDTRVATDLSYPTGTRSSGPDSTPSLSSAKIVPKGLRSFNADDADFFLRLLPGPYDRDGLPESVRFWKTRIERTDSESSFSVGLLYGPSGCGKSSLIKAGLLPRLAKYVIPTYIEATAGDTDLRLLKSLRKRFPGVEQFADLKETLTALRQGQYIPEGDKLLIIVDQFEQWLHATRDTQNTDLEQALRQCDGEHVQCILMVRDDFWLAASRFMRELEVNLLEDQNLALVDLFDTDHATNVLAAFGRAFGKLPQSAKEISKQEADFLRKSVDELAEHGRVNSARLAVFAEMMKTKSWTIATLKQVGGTKGIGVTFLEGTLAGPTASPEHRFHQKAARAVLKALLPETGSDIKGHLRSHDELLQASGYAERPKDFESLVRILDSEVRLITPTDPEGNTDEQIEVVADSGQRYYQLTHDYLVHSVRDWLNRKQLETRRGRAEVRLEEHSNWWRSKPIKRHLPSVWSYLQFRTFTSKRNWNDSQRQMMSVADRHYGLRAAVLAATVMLAVWGWRQVNGQIHARDLRNQLIGNPITDVPGIVSRLKPYRAWIDPMLVDADRQATIEGDERKLLRVNLALMPVDDTRVDYLHDQMLRGPNDAFLIIRSALDDSSSALLPDLWQVVADDKETDEVRLRAACAIAEYAPDDRRWLEYGQQVASNLVTASRMAAGPWVEALQPASWALTKSLMDIIEDEQRTRMEREVAAKAFANYASFEPKLTDQLQARLAREVAEDASNEDRLEHDHRQANIAVALLAMGHFDKARSVFQHRPDSTLQTAVIHRGAASVPPEVLVTALQSETDASVRRALLLALGEYRDDILNASTRRALITQINTAYLLDQDPGVRQAAKWLVARWSGDKSLVETPRPLGATETSVTQRWYVNSVGQVMICIPAGQEFTITDKFEGGTRTERPVRIPYAFAAGESEVTVGLFDQFMADHPEFKRNHRQSWGPTNQSPENSVSWYQAAAFCNWLSRREMLGDDQLCYVPNEAGQFAAGMRSADDFLSKTGYRLPISDEWECAALAGATTDFFFGQDVNMAGYFAWSIENAGGTTRPVFQLKPNPFGLFSTSGNVWEWCHELVMSPSDEVPGSINDAVERSIAGGVHSDAREQMRSAHRSGHPVGQPFVYIGFRVFRTLPNQAGTGGVQPNK